MAETTPLEHIAHVELRAAVAQFYDVITIYLFPWPVGRRAFWVFTTPSAFAPYVIDQRSPLRGHIEWIDCLNLAGRLQASAFRYHQPPGCHAET